MSRLIEDIQAAFAVTLGVPHQQDHGWRAAVVMASGQFDYRVAGNFRCHQAPDE
jgi:hypothetical protein